MSWINTSDRVDHDQLQIARVWQLVDRIEYLLSKKLGYDVMAHEIDELKDDLKRYQDGDLKRIYFINKLSKMVDELEF